MDNFYNSVGLGNILVENKTHTIGILRSNRKLNPTHITSKTIKLKKGDHKFARKGSVCICRWKDKKYVFIITTGVHTVMVTVKINEEWKSKNRNQ